ncbi:hypothetical protein J437_LFUL016054 [Ladona fulva]|uniref:Guided entry of tail-anchored proteins factor 1 n=1 Tax=Ladona fulva TaxID=123851 RepID=A0A8K0P8N1_LADFU|nr:hypothetical protein J437_LFUL016054 [Ladona fulva]
MELLIYSSLISVLSAFVPLFVKILIPWIYRKSKQEIQLQEEAFELRKQMSEISMVDEFAKHAKLQRKLNKVNDELKKLANERLASSMKGKLYATYSLRLLFTLLLPCIIWFYRAVPVIVFPKERLWPVSEILSWPTGVPGGISVAVWIFVTNRVARKIASCLT